jgi:hypothetical protein
MAVHHGSSRPKFAPTVVPQAATNFNQDQFTASAYVAANGYDTTVYFDYSTSSSFTPGSYTTVVYWFTVTGYGLNYPYYNTTGLTPNTTYYYRCRAVNAIGTTIGATNSFTTWSLKTYTNTTAGSYTVSIPSITPYLGPTIAPTIYNMLLYGGGGGANYGGGGGGGYRLFSSHQSSTAGTQNISITIGGGGAAGNGGGGTGTATAGGSTTLTIGSTSWTGGGGGAGQHPGNCGAPFGTGGAVGSGSNPAYGGGNNAYGWYRVCSQTYICTEYNKLNECINGYYQDNYCWDCGYYACGGGGGTDAGGASACCHNTSSQVGGNGGAGGGAYGLRGGNGGGGYGTQGSGSAGSVPAGSGSIVGTGGSHFGAGVAGGITFQYYGP